MERWLTRFGELGPTQSDRITAAPASPHGALVRALDACAKAGPSNIFVLSAR